MAVVVDTLETRYIMNAEGYVNGANQVTNATKKVSAAQKFGQTNISGFIGGVKTVAATLAAVGAGIVGVSAYAMNEAAKFDRMAATFAGAFGSVEKGVEVMKSLEAYAGKSAFNLDGLVEASTQLAASGLSIARFLPLAEKFALVISGTDPQGLQQVVGALMRIKGGSYGEAMETFRKAGISANDLRAKGLNVTKGGEIQSSAEELFKVVEEIAKGRISSIAESVSKSDAVTASNLWDNMGVAVREVGSILNDDFLPVLTAITQGVKGFAQAGGFNALLAGIGAIGVTSQDVASTLIGVGSIFAGLASFFMSYYKTIGEAFDALSKGGVVEFSKKLLSSIPQAYQDAKSGIANYNQTIADELAKPNKEAPKLPDAPPGAGDLNNKPVTEVVKNTRKMVELQKQTLDLHKMVFGNGAAAAGVGAEDLSDFRARRSSTPRYHVNSTLQKIGVLLADFAHESQYAR